MNIENGTSFNFGMLTYSKIDFWLSVHATCILFPILEVNFSI